MTDPVALIDDDAAGASDHDPLAGRFHFGG